MGAPWDQAYVIARDAADPLPGRTVPVEEALGQVLAGPVCCVRPVPAFDNAAMDGYAVAGDGPWTVRGRVLAGHATGEPLGPGDAVEIATGAPVPDGAEAVLPYEECTVTAGVVHAVRGQRAHIRRAGDALAEGAVVVPAGRVVTATVVAAAVQAGAQTVSTHRPPTVSLLVTGDEVITSGVPGPGQVRDSFTGPVAAVATRAGGRFRDSRHLPDDPDRLAAALAGSGADVIVVSGSSSKGAADHLHTLLAAEKATWLVCGVRCRPGHPQGLAVLPDGRFVVSLPGNPYAGLVAALTLLEPLVATLAGRPPGPLPTAAVSGRARLMPGGARIVPVTGGRIAGPGGSAGLHLAAIADALAVLPDTWTDGAAAPLLALP
ncbi:molybdopterin molybdenumtransferase MoeA [Actinoplanes lobatus]|uniref:Molybdopterin molybdenumtransferase n=1 Tax=Actinoplanes lobatus TaxID=113568 RepID=A0A7W7HLI9_9ACTN|nr:molybdopterin molybdotransferase MoeA [Actinoplanes lobatus]MBB4752781.1 molybdopterin molybdotransferase [Actinoplanes lobatus]GGN91031.1 molybdopterin molybdenumtransferase MoeA [Actinoplanes lobatus]GIE43880.1 molybdopterin molybdenumtransferase MoeA [Actinoplanes lobatus]